MRIADRFAREIQTMLGLFGGGGVFCAAAALAVPTIINSATRRCPVWMLIIISPPDTSRVETLRRPIRRAVAGSAECRGLASAECTFHRSP
jgi:hypothetical protein